MAPPAALGVDPDPSSPYHLANTASKPGSNMFVQFSATCYYFGQSLTDELTKAGDLDPTPIGLIHTAWGGSTIEQVSPSGRRRCAMPCNARQHLQHLQP